MLDKPFAEIEKGDIDAVVADKTPESRQIEYKLQLPSEGEDGKKEFLADISSFANASGGNLLFGVQEARDGANKPTGVPEAAIGLAGINADQAIQRLENLARDGVAPRIPGVQMKAIAGFGAGPVIVVRIPKSWAGPHMIKSSQRFFGRNSNGKFPLDVTEIRAAFLNSHGISDRIRQLRDERVGRILADETPVPFNAGPKTILHMIPVSVWATGDSADISAFINRSLHLPTGAMGRPNLEGYVRFTPGRDGLCSEYTQLFRNGATEAVWRTSLSASGGVPSETLERGLVHAIQDFKRLYGEMGVGGELVTFFSMLGFRGCHLATGGFGVDAPQLQQDNLLFPELILADDVASTELPAVARGLVDHIWQSFGFDGSPNYVSPSRWRFA